MRVVPCFRVQIQIDRYSFSCLFLFLKNLNFLAQLYHKQNINSALSVFIKENPTTEIPKLKKKFGMTIQPYLWKMMFV